MDTHANIVSPSWWLEFGLLGIALPFVSLLLWGALLGGNEPGWPDARRDGARRGDRDRRLSRPRPLHAGDRAGRDLVRDLRTFDGHRRALHVPGHRLLRRRLLLVAQPTSARSSCARLSSQKRASIARRWAARISSIVQPRLAPTSASSPGRVIPTARQSSLLIVIGTPAASIAPTGCSARVGKMPSLTLDDGHMLSVIRCSASRSTSAGSSIARAPWSTRCTPSRSITSRTPSGPDDSPAWAVSPSPSSPACL